MTAAAAARSRAPRENLETVLAAIYAKAAESQDAGVSVGELLEAVGRRSYGPLLLVIGLFAISPLTLIPGTTWLAAAVTLVVAGQMTLGLQRPWLPAGLRARTVSARLICNSAEKARPWAARIDKFIKPRFEFLAKPPFANLVGLACILQALITIPLGLIPLAPAIPSAAIVLFGLGVTARDGLLIAFGLACSAAAFAVVFQLFF